MINLLLIGAGALGSRHLQSCVKLQRPATIFVVDPNADALDLARQRAGEVDWGSSHDVRYFADIDSVDSGKFDFMVLATGASVRAQLLSAVLSRHSVEYAILEKVLFQDLASYDSSGLLLERHGVTCFVNCPLRTYPFYRRVKAQYFSESPRIELTYRGGEWVGLACNTIHFLDLLQYLTGEELVEVSVDSLDSGFIDSKRAGHIEVTGRLDARFDRCSSLSAESIRGSDEASLIQIRSDDLRIVIDELTGAYQIYRGPEKLEDDRFDLVYQSDLTHRMIEQILETKSCELPAFFVSSQLHQVYVRSLLGHYSDATGRPQDRIPIT